MTFIIAVFLIITGLVGIATERLSFWQAFAILALGITLLVIYEGVFLRFFGKGHSTVVHQHFASDADPGKQLSLVEDEK